MGRILDVLFSAIGLVLTAPLLLLAAAGILLTDGRPIVYRAKRCGRGGTVFDMLKLRTMCTDADRQGKITAPGDARVFPFGRILRASKVDELPQLLNILKGDMAIVGPRPEDPAFVSDHYAPAGLETLEVRPGLTSPGTVFYFAHEEQTIQADADRDYLERLLPIKLALDHIYVRDRSLLHDFALIVKTAYTVLARLLGVRNFARPRELERAEELAGTMLKDVDLGSVESGADGTVA